MTPPGRAGRVGFVGPEPLETGDPLFGRDRELADLTDLLLAERAVLLYAPSGAGKTSLIQAGLVPRLRDEGLDPPARYADSPAGDLRARPAVILRVGDRPGRPAAGGNRYVRNTLLALDEHRPPADRLPAAELPGSIRGYLDANYLPRRPPPVLIFDQFEEVLTLDPTDVRAKRTFFRSVGEAVAAGGRWFLFAVREDHLAELDPYLDYFPRRLPARYRIDRLAPGPAVRAFCGTGRKAEVAIPPLLARGLVTELRKLRAPRPDGTFVPLPGPDGRPLLLPSVEPIYLQLVGRRLLAGKPAGTVVGPADVAGLAADGLPGVDRELARYFAAEVGEATGGDRQRERQVRRWFDRVLLNRDGRRVTARADEAAGHGVAPGVLDRLDARFVIRRVVEGGVLCYEVAHDRLAGAVRWDNIRWRRDHLTPFERAAALWADTAEPRPADLLVEGAVLAQGEAAARAGRLEPDETAFLKASQARRTRRRRRRAVVWLLVLAAAVGAYRYQARRQHADRERWEQARTLQDRRRADEARRAWDQFQAQYSARQAREFRLITQARQLLGANPPRPPADAAAEALWLMTEAGYRPGAEPGVSLPAAESALRDALQRLGSAQLKASERPIRAVAASPDGARVAIGGDGWLGVLGAGQWVWTRPGYDVTALAFSPDGEHLLFGTAQGEVWATAAGPIGAVVEPVKLGRTRANSPVQAVRYLGAPGKPVWVVAVGVDGSGFVQLRPDGPVTDLDTPRADGGGRATAVEFTPAGTNPARRRLYVGTTGGGIVGWELTPGALKADRENVTAGTAVTAIAVHPSAAVLAAAGYRSGVQLWALNTDTKRAGNPTPTRLDGFAAESLAFHPSGEWLGVGTTDRNVRLYRWRGDTDFQLEEGALGPQVGRGLGAWAFDPGGGRPVLVGGEAGRSVRVWTLDAPRAAPFNLPGSDAGTTVVAVARNPDRVIAGGIDGTVRVWDLARATGRVDAEPRVLHGRPAGVTAVGVSPDGRWVAALDTAGGVAVWDTLNPADCLGVVAVPWPLGGVVAWDTRRKTPVPREQSPAGFVRADSPLVVTDAAVTVAPEKRGPAARWAFGAPPLEWADAGALAPGHRSTAWSRDGRHAVDLTDAGGGHLRPVVRAAGEPAAAAPAERREGPASGALAPDQKWLVGTAGGRAWLWPVDLAARGVGPRVELPAAGVERDGVTNGPLCLAAGPGGEYAAAGFASGVVRVWQSDPKQALAPPRQTQLSGHRGPVLAAAFAPDGRRLATAGADGLVRLWDLPAVGRVDPVVLSGHVGEVTALQFAGVGENLRLVSGGADGTVRVWTANPVGLMNRARLLLADNVP